MSRPKVAFFDFTSCEGCQLTVLDALQTHPELLDAVEIVQFREAMTEKGEDYLIAFVEGSLARPADEERLRGIREKAGILVALGSCAHIGGVNAIRNRQPLEKVRKHEFQAYMAAWGTGVDPDQSWNLWRSEEYEKGRNYVGYSNPRVDELFELGRREFDSEKRCKIYQEIHKIVYEDQPYTWISNPPILAVFNKRIRGVQFSPRGIFNFNPSFEGWWVPSGSSKNNAAMP